MAPQVPSAQEYKELDELLGLGDLNSKLEEKRQWQQSTKAL